MPYKDRSKQLAYLKKYNEAHDKIKYEKRKVFLINYLGGKCVVCESEDDLEFDHISRREKSFAIMKKWNRPMSVLLPELDKCQLLCKEHHLEKTKLERRELV